MTSRSGQAALQALMLSIPEFAMFIPLMCPHYPARAAGCRMAGVMLYKFKSKVTGDVIMLEANGRRVLQIIGKDAANSAQGIVLPEQMPAAIAALERAILQEEAARSAAREAALAEGREFHQADTISLRQRALPFIDMLRRCEQAGKEIVWNT